MSVAVSMAIQTPPINPTLPRALGSPDLLQLPGVRLVTVTQPEVPIQPRHPRPRALGPLDQHDGLIAHHVVEPQILGFGRRPQAVAVDVIDQAALGRAVLVDQRVGRTGGEASPPVRPDRKSTRLNSS